MHLVGLRAADTVNHELLMMKEKYIQKMHLVGLRAADTVNHELLMMNEKYIQKMHLVGLYIYIYI